MQRIIPGQTYIMKNPNSTGDIENIVKDVSRLIRGASPFIEQIEILNRTKGCIVDIAFLEGKVQVIMTNPHDDVFDLNEHENPVVPSSPINYR